MGEVNKKPCSSIYLLVGGYHSLITYRISNSKRSLEARYGRNTSNTTETLLQPLVSFTAELLGVSIGVELYRAGPEILTESARCSKKILSATILTIT